MRVLVCGGRDFGNNDGEERFIHDELQDLRLIPGEDVIIAGMAKGVDTVAERFAKHYGIEFEGFPAEWDKHGKRAGFLRNSKMLTEGKPDLVVAFPGGKGTEMMMRLAASAGVEVIALEYD